MSEIVLAILLLAPLLITFLLRSDAALGFLTLCTGFAAATYASGNTKHWLEHLTTSGQLLSISTISLIMIVLPLILTLLITRHHVPKSKFPLQIIPALAIGGLLALTTTPLLTEWVNVNFNSISLWTQIQNQEAIIIGVGALSSLLLIWSSGFKRPKHHK